MSPQIGQVISDINREQISNLLAEQNSDCMVRRRCEMLATTIGGGGTEEGPVVGTVIVVFLYFLLARYAEISLIIQGIILGGILLPAPQGVVGSIRRWVMRTA